MNKREEQMGMEYWKKRALKAEAALEEIQSLKDWVEDNIDEECPLTGPLCGDLSKWRHGND